jgi:hypothetical protein
MSPLCRGGAVPWWRSTCAATAPWRSHAVEMDPCHRRTVEEPCHGGRGPAPLPHRGGAALWRRRTVEEEEPAAVAPRHRIGSEGR